jgi:2-dehydropantoate 2-reductase
MKIGVMGAGSVGCYFGGLLARAGHDVTLIGRPAFVDAVRAGGLRLDIGGEPLFIPIHAAFQPAALSECDIVIFSVKSGDTGSAGRELAPHLKTGAVVLSFQNGVDNAERLAAILGRPVIPVSVYVATEMVGQGHVRHHGRGDIVIGPSAEDDRLLQTFNTAGIPTIVSKDVHQALWQKLVINCAYNALSAVSQMPYGPMGEIEGVAEVMQASAEECAAVARACGVPITVPELDALLALTRTMPKQTSSTAQDLARGRPTEIDYLNGYVVRKGREARIATPVNLVLTTLVRMAEPRAATGQ